MKDVSNNAGKRVVIFGGGMAGVQLAKNLSRDLNVTLVDPNDYFEVPMAAPRNLVRPSFADQAIIPYFKALPHVSIVRGTLTEMREDGGIVTLEDSSQTTVTGAVYVLSTGSQYTNNLMRSFGVAAQERKGLYMRYKQYIESARRILIVGGGPIGVEVAGELSENYPNKKLVLLEGGPRLLAGTSEAAAKHAETVLSSRGVSILVGEKLQSSSTEARDIFGGKGEATTASGRRIAYDLMIWCTGGRPNTGYMQPHLAGALDDKGRIQVSPDLRVKGHKTLFALGDITDLRENKMAWHITGQVRVAATNVRRVLQNPDQPSKLAAYKAETGNPKMAVTLGSRQGVVHMPPFGVIRSPLLTRKAKAEHMLVPQYRKVLGVG